MGASFAGSTAELYARYRRDLPDDQATLLAAALRLGADNVVVDLGCGTGQLAVPLSARCRAVVAVDPEPAMLLGLHRRQVRGVVPVLGADTDLPSIADLLRVGHNGGAGAVVVGNALHWMDGEGLARRVRPALRPGGVFAVVTQGPPLWLGARRWQREVRAVLEGTFGAVSTSCGSDEVALAQRVGLLDEAGWQVEVLRWRAAHPVDTEWVVGHLGSALSADALDPATTADLRAVLDRTPPADLVEDVETTVVFAR